MNPIKNSEFLSAESIISIHFNDEIKPTKIQYSFDHEGKKMFLAEYGCDSNDLTEIKDMAISEAYYEKSEGFHFHTYDVKNGSLGTHFEDSMIPKINS